MHYQPGISDHHQAQEAPRLLTVSAAGGRRFERPEHELELERARARWVGLEPPQEQEYRAGMGLDMTHQTTSPSSSRRRRTNRAWMMADSTTNAAQPLDEVSTSIPTSIPTDALSHTISAEADTQGELFLSTYPPTA